MAVAADAVATVGRDNVAHECRSHGVHASHGDVAVTSRRYQGKTLRRRLACGKERVRHTGVRRGSRPISCSTRSLVPVLPLLQ